MTTTITDRDENQGRFVATKDGVVYLPAHHSQSAGRVSASYTISSPKDKIVSILKGKPGNYRTIGGISRDTGLNKAVVEETVAGNTDMFERSPIKLFGAYGYRLRSDNSQ